MSPGPIIHEIDVQIAITLASIGYLGEFCTIEQKHKLMSDALQQPDLPTNANWSIVWGPAEYEPTYSLWYIAEGRDAQGHPALGVVIRGTQMKRLESLNLDGELVLAPVPFSGAKVPPDARVSTGFATEFTNLLKAVDQETLLTGDQFLSERLNANPDLEVKVIGHSLGGATAPIMAMWIRNEFSSIDVRPFPFGGQTPGNAQFAKWYGDAFPNVPTRYVNDLDLCPLMFSELSRMKTIWGADVPCPDYIKAAIDVAVVDMAAKGIAYETTDRAHVYEGALYNVSGPWAWEHEASAQHEHFFYMSMCGIALSVIRKGLGPTWSPPPGTGDCG